MYTARFIPKLSKNIVRLLLFEIIPFISIRVLNRCELKLPHPVASLFCHHPHSHQIECYPLYAIDYIFLSYIFYGPLSFARPYSSHEPSAVQQASFVHFIQHRIPPASDIDATRKPTSHHIINSPLRASEQSPFTANFAKTHF